jgi:hypothetical protein
MSAADVQVKILEPMQRVYLPPRKMEQGDELAALRDYVETLQQFDGSDLSEAWRKVRETHTTRSWPLPSAFYKVANESRRDRNEASGGGKRRGDGPTPGELWERWKAVSRSQLAYEAVKRGVAWSLKCAVLYDKKKPEQIDLREFTTRKERAAKTKAMIEAGEPIEHQGKMLPIFAGDNKRLALSMYAHVQMNETRVQDEIRYGVREAPE